MDKKAIVLRTKRLLITPMTEAETEELISGTPYADFGRQCKELLEDSKLDPDNRIWYLPWKICLKSDNTYIGEIGFFGPKKDSSVEIGFSVKDEFRGNGYTSEALKVVAEWAFSNEGIFFVEAEVRDENSATKKVLEKLEFKPDGVSAFGTKYVKEKVEAWISIYMCLGISVGTAIGVSMNNIGVGMCLGMSLGMCIGALIDSEMRKKREKLREARRSLES